MDLSAIVALIATGNMILAVFTDNFESRLTHISIGLFGIIVAVFMRL